MSRQTQTDLDELRAERAALLEDIEEQRRANRAASPEHLLAAIDEAIAKVAAEVEVEQQAAAEQAAAKAEAAEVEQTEAVRTAIASLAVEVAKLRQTAAAHDSAQIAAGRVVSKVDRCGHTTLALLVAQDVVAGTDISVSRDVLARFDADAVNAKRAKEEAEARMLAEKIRQEESRPEEVARRRDNEIARLQRRLEGYPSGSKQRAAIEARTRLAELEAEAEAA